MTSLTIFFVLVAICSIIPVYIIIKKPAQKDDNISTVIVTTNSEYDAAISKYSNADYITITKNYTIAQYEHKTYYIKLVNKDS